MENQNLNGININFVYESSELITIVCDLKDTVGTVINEFSEKIGVESSLVIFLYSGRALDNNNYNKPISEIINRSDKDLMQMNILAYRIDSDILPSDEITIILIFDSLKALILKGKKEETLKTIIRRENPEIIFSLDSLVFYYEKKAINLNQKFLDIADENDQRVNGLTINIVHKQKVIIKFINNALGEKRIISFPEYKMARVIGDYCIENNMNIQFYLFQYKNINIDLEKTIRESDGKNGSIEGNTTENGVYESNIMQINKINQYESNELVEIDINVIEKNCCQKNKVKIFCMTSLILAITNIL